MFNINKYGKIDYLKIFFSILVVSLHTGPLNKIEGSIFYNLWWGIAHIAVPFFFMSCGFWMCNGGGIYIRELKPSTLIS